MRILKILLIVIFFPLLHAIVQWLYYFVFDQYLEKKFGKKDAEKLIAGRLQSIQRFFYWDIRDKLNLFHYVLYWVSHILFIAIVILMILRVFAIPNAVQYVSWTGFAYFIILYLLRISK